MRAGVVTQENSRQSHTSRRHIANGHRVAINLEIDRHALELVLADARRGLRKTGERVIVAGLEIGVLVEVVAVEGDQRAAGVVLDLVVDVAGGFDGAFDETGADANEAAEGSRADLEERGEEGDNEAGEDSLHFAGWKVDR